MPEINDQPLTWRDITTVAEGAPLTLSAGVRSRVQAARGVVEALIARGVRTYGVNTGVGALHEVLIDRGRQRAMSRNLLMSHAVGVGDTLPTAEVRAVVAAQVNNLAHGYSGVRADVLDQMLWLLGVDCVPVVPARGSVGYLSHMAHVALVLIGEGTALVEGVAMPGGEALARLGRAPLVLEAKEGLSLINGAPCATGLACLCLARGERLLDAGEAVAAASFEALRGQLANVAPEAMALHRSPGLNGVAERLRARLEDSPRVRAAAGRHTQDPMALRALPQVHGAARDALDHVARTVDRELASATDNPLVFGTPDAPEVRMSANAVASGVALAMDLAAIALANVAALAERRLDRLINPLVSGLPAFLVAEPGLQSGLMIAQYTAAALTADNRRLAAPASLDGGVTSGLQEDHLPHATGASLKALAIADNLAQVIGIELVCAAQAAEHYPAAERGAATGRLIEAFRGIVPPYADDRPLADDLARAKSFVMAGRASGP